MTAKVNPGRAVASAVALALLSVGVVATNGHAIAGCADPAPGGDWPSYSHDLSNTRNQPEETVIGPEQAAELAPVKVLNLASIGVGGAIDTTPVIANGCIYIGTNNGALVALNADTFEKVWQQQVLAGMRGSPSVQNGRVIVNVNKTDHPYTAAFDALTGTPIWQTEISTQPGSGSEASPAVWDGKVFAAVAGFLAESNNTVQTDPRARLDFRGEWKVLDEATGAVLGGGTVIDDDAFFGGDDSGGGVWSTAAIDTETGFAFVGSGNPFNAHEHEYTNSILKIDLNGDADSNPDFAQIVDHYHGTTDQYVEALNEKPVCEAYVDVFTCENFDLDFGASPQLFTADDGTKLVGDLQKSGVYHVAKQADMQHAWDQRVGGLLIVFVGNLGTASYDGESIVVGGSGPSAEWGLEPSTGAVQWAAPVGDPRHIQATSTANDVAYSVDNNGVLNIWNARSGEVIQARPMALDTGANSTSSGAGVSIARNTVFAASGTYLVAYR